MLPCEVCVRHRREVVRLAAACLAATLMACRAPKSPSLTAQGDPCLVGEPATEEARRTAICRREMNDLDALLRGGYVRDGLLHFRIGYDHDVQPLQKQAFQAAMSSWNRVSHVSGFVFEDTRTADIDFRLQRGASVLDPKAIQLDKEKCAGYMSAGSFIWYSRFNMAWVENDTQVPDAARIYAHELGHALNLDHNAHSDLMREGNAGTACRDLGTSILGDVRDEDARHARTCACDVRRNAARTPRRP
jgi:Matrixin